jgi:hypothetical protein
MNAIKLRSRNAAPSTELRRSGSTERLVGRNGELNASNNKDLITAIAQLVQASAKGETYSEQKEETVATVAERRTAVLAAYHDNSSRDWQELGSALANQLSETADREGFMRRYLGRSDAAIQGGVPRIRVQTKNVTALIATAPMQVQPLIVRDKHFFPPEFYVQTNILVEEKEIAQTPGDILEDKFFEGQESVMVQEDRTFKSMMDSYVGVSNDLQILSGGLTPQSLASLRNQITRWNVPARGMLFASDVWEDLVASTAFGAWYDPVSQSELVLTGYLGTIMGLETVSDAYRHPQLKVLTAGEIYLTSDAEYFGAYTDRGPVQVRETDGRDEGVPARGWHMFEILSMSLHNPRAVCKGMRA